MRASHKRFINFSKILKLVLSLGLACAFTLSFSEAIAAPNYEINYQGKLTDSTGSAVADGTYNMRFWLLTSPSVATTSAVWTESLTSTNMVQVTNGLFSVMLGSTTPLTSVDFNQTLYLGVEVGGTGSPSWDGEMSPRKILGAVPAAFEAEHAADADTVGGVASTSFLRSDQADTASGLLTFSNGFLSQASSTISRLTTLTATTTNLVINSERFTDLTGTGLQNTGNTLAINTTYLNTLYASTSAFNTYAELDAIVADATLTHNGLIDTSAELLAIVTNETGTGRLVFSASPAFSGTATFSALTATSTLTMSGTAANIALGSNYLSGDGGDEGVFVASDGKVGVGTAAPTAAFEVYGDIVSKGTRWATSSVADATASWQNVAYGNGQFVAIAYSGTNRVMTSPDGITWTARSAAEANQWRDIAYGNGLFVAVSQSGTNRVMTSPDGITWTARSAAEANSWMSVTYGNGLFAAISSDGTNRVMTSPDGITWTARSAAEANSWSDVTYGNGLFVAVAGSGTNRVMTSPDGITWTGYAGIVAGWNDVTYGNGLFVAVGGGAIMTSPNGTTWTSRTSPAGNGWNAVVYGGGLFVAVSSNNTSQIMTSPDGITWTARTEPTTAVWLGLAYGNGRFVATPSISSYAMFSGQTEEYRLVHNNTYQGGFFLKSGSLGIGTTTPNQKLSIFNNGADAAIEFSTVSGSSEKWTIGIDDSDGGKFKISSSSALGTNDRFVIDGAGRVGIGISSPAQRFAVALGSSEIAQFNDGTNASAIWGQNIGFLSELGEARITTRTTSPLAFFTGGSLNSMGEGTERMRILNTGEVGIGTSTPTQELTVSGDVRVTGRIYDSSNSAGTNGMVLKSTGTGFTWVATSTLGFGTGTVTGTGSANRVAYWSGASALSSDSTFTFANSLLTAPVFNASGASTTVLSVNSAPLLTASTTKRVYTLGTGYGTHATGTATDSFLIGLNAGRYATAIYESVFMGWNAGYGAVNAGQSNFFGTDAGSGATDAYNSNFFGLDAGKNAADAGFSNFLGVSAGSGATNAQYSNFLGTSAGFNATNASLANFMGNNAGSGATNAAGSNFFGSDAGYNASGARYSNFIGDFAGKVATNAQYSNFIGVSAGQAGTNAGYSNFIGYLAGFSAPNAATSTFIGYYAGNNADNASNALFLGNFAGYNDTVNNTSNGGSSIAIGRYAGTGGFSNSIALGRGVINSAATQLNIGNLLYGTNIYNSDTQSAAAVSSGNIGIGTSTPNRKLTVQGAINISSTTSSYQIDGDRVLFSDFNDATTIVGAGAGNSLLLNNQYYNTAIGVNSLYSATSSWFNTAVGYQSLYSNTSGQYNTAVGNDAMWGNTSADYNTVFGNNALYGNAAGSNNSVFGYNALSGNEGMGNVAFGFSAGDNLTSGDRNILIGYNIDAPTATSDNILNIGNLLFGTGIDGTGTTYSSGNIGIGTSTPSAKLTVAGTGLFTSTLTAPYFNASGTSTTLVALATSPIFQTSENWDSVFLGFDAASGTGIQAQNSFFVGANSGNNATNADASNFIGYSSGSGATNADNSNFFGEQSGYQATNAEYSNFSGYNAGYSATNASYSNFFGYEAGRDAPGSFYSNFIGESSGYSASNAFYSNFIGVSAGGYSDFANSSNFIGFTAGYQAPNAATSTFIGYSAGYSADNASNALFLGNFAGYNDTVNNTSNSGSSIAIGRYAGTGGFSNSIALGRGVINSAATQLNIGNLLYGTGIYNSDTQSASAVSGGKVGIGTSTPNSTLTVAGTFSHVGAYPNFTNLDTAEAYNGIDLRAKTNSGYAGVELNMAALNSSNATVPLFALVSEISNISDTSTRSFSIYDGDGNRRLFLNSLGYIGIGTSTPTQRLTVAGNLRVTGSIYDSSNSAGTNGMVLKSTGTGFTWVATSTLGFGTGTVTGTGSANRVAYWSGASALSSDSTFTFANSLLTAPVFNASGASTTVLSYSNDPIFRYATTSSSLSVGIDAGLALLSSGLRNTVFGTSAFYTATSSDDNTVMGYEALSSLEIGNGNVALGSEAMLLPTIASFNVGIGNGVLYNMGEGYGNTAIGYNALSSAGDFSSNTVIGYEAGYGNVGNNNLLLGYKAGEAPMSGNNNIIIGHDIDIANSSWSNRLNIGNLLFGTDIDGTGTTLSSGNIGIGTSTPNARLSVSDTISADEEVFNLWDNGLKRFSFGEGTYSQQSVFTINQANDNAGAMISFSTNNDPVNAAWSIISYEDEFQIYGNRGAYVPMLKLYNSFSSSTGNENVALLQQTIGGQSGTAGYTGLKVDITESSVGSGNRYLANFLSNSTSRFVIEADGNVGIGTTTPTQVLSVVGTTTISNGLLVGSGEVGYLSYSFNSDSNTGLYNPGNNVLSLVTGGADRLYIDNANIGIGTTTPQEPFHWVAASNNDAFRIQNNDVGEYIDFNNDDTDLEMTFVDGSNIFSFGYHDTSDNLIISNTTSLESGQLFSFTQGGNFGIGTTSPYASLSIEDQTPRLTLFDNDNVLSATNPTWGIRATTGGFNIQSSVDNISYTDRLYVGVSGRVGINTTDPQGMLHIASTTDAGAEILLNSNDTVAFPSALGSLWFGSQEANGYRGAGIRGFAAADFNTNDYPSYLAFYTTSDSSGTSTQRMILTQDGNLGIGTSTPSGQLQVIGDGYFDGLTVQDTGAVSHSQLILQANLAASGGTNRPVMDFLGANGTGIRLQMSGDTSNAFRVGTYQSDQSGVGEQYLEINGAGDFVLGTTTTLLGRFSDRGLLGLSNEDSDVQSGEIVSGLAFISNESSGTGPIPSHDVVAQIAAVAAAQHSGGFWPTDLVFSTLNGSNVLTERMRLLQGGNLGIGTTTPQKLLDVVGTQAAAAVTSRVSNLSSTGYAEWVASNNGSAYGALGVYGTGHALANQTILGTSDHLVLSTNTSVQNGGSGSIYFMTGGWDTSTQRRMIINASGNVGIGTTSPSTRLHVASASALQGTFTSTGANRASIRIQNATAGQQSLLEFFDASTLTYQIGKGSTNGFFMYDATNARDFLNVSTAGALTLQGSAGNVGIGTTTPNQKLSIFANGADTAIEFSRASGATEKWTIGVDDSDGGKFKISSSSALGTNDRFVIDGKGNVGIGVISDMVSKLMVYDDNADSADINSLNTQLDVSGTPTTARALKLYVNNNATSGTISDLQGAHVQIDVQNAGNVTNVTNHSFWGNLNGAGSVTNWRMINIVNPGDGGAGSITNLYGLKIDNLTSATNNYSIYTGSAQSYFGGNVGIGTTTPSTPLAVAGTIRALRSAAPTQYVDIFATGGEAFVRSSASTKLNFGVNGNNMTITSTGNIGIGTTTPNQKLSIFRSAADAAIEFSTVSGANEKWTIGIDDSDGAKFKISSSSVLGTSDRLVIDGSGNIGIGTSSPAVALDVNGSGYFHGNGTIISLNQYGGVSDLNRIAITGNRAMFGYNGTNANAVVQAGASKGIEFNVNNGTFGSGQAAVITSAGNFGIGTTNPTQKLSVAGNILLSSQSEAAIAWGTGYNGSQESITAMTEFNGYLYAGQGNGTGDGDVLICTPSTAGNASDCDNASDWATSYNGSQEVIWSFAEFKGKLYAGQGSTLGAPTAGDGDIFVCNPATTGDTAKCDSGDWSTSRDSAALEAVFAMAEFNGRLYAVGGLTTGTDGDIYVCNPDTAGTAGICDNASDWTTAYDGAQEGFASLAVFNGRIYAAQGISSGDGDIYASSDGTTWAISYNGAAEYFRGMSVYNGKLYAAQSATAAGSADVYMTTDGVAWTMSFNGSQEWLNALTVYNGSIYTAQGNGTGDGDIFSMTGSSTWATSYNGSQEEITSFAVYNGKLYAGQGNGTGDGDVLYMNQVATTSYALKFAAGNSTGDLWFAEESLFGASGPNGEIGTFKLSHALVTSAGAYDVAEDYPTADKSLMPGDIVSFDPNRTEHLEKATKEKESLIAGVVSGQPGFLLSSDDREGMVPTALVGRVEVKVSDENGPIEVGDSVTISSEAGVGMKANFGDRAIGYALAPLDANDSDKTVLIYVSTHYAFGMNPDPALFASASSSESQLGGQTIIERLAQLASGFVDGVLSTIGINTERVNTATLCVGTVCVDEATFLNIVEQSGGVATPDPIIQDPVDPVVEDDTSSTTPEEVIPPVEEIPVEEPPADPALPPEDDLVIEPEPEVAVEESAPSEEVIEAPAS